jgi:hypothetical protein
MEGAHCADCVETHGVIMQFVVRIGIARSEGSRARSGRRTPDPARRPEAA